MAKVCSVPDSVHVPTFEESLGEDGRYDMKKDDELREKFIGDLREWLRIHEPEFGHDDAIGCVVRFPIADGSAEYMVKRMKPVELLWLPLGDAWQIPEAHERGLRASDVRQLVDTARAYSNMFGSKEA